jgi:excisionase family DNA binding protein
VRFPGKNSTAILTVSEVSEYLRIHPTTLYRLLRRHQLPGFKIGNDWRISAQAMNRWLREMEDRRTEATYLDAKASDRSSVRQSNNKHSKKLKLPE